MRGTKLSKSHVPQFFYLLRLRLMFCRNRVQSSWSITRSCCSFVVRLVSSRRRQKSCWLIRNRVKNHFPIPAALLSWCWLNQKSRSDLEKSWEQNRNPRHHPRLNRFNIHRWIICFRRGNMNDAPEKNYSLSENDELFSLGTSSFILMPRANSSGPVMLWIHSFACFKACFSPSEFSLMICRGAMAASRPELAGVVARTVELLCAPEMIILCSQFPG